MSQTSDSLADVPAAPAQPDGGAELRSRTLVRLLARLIRLRSLVLPVVLAFTLWIGVSDEATWRRILLLVVAGVMTSLITHDLLVRERVRLTPNLVVVVLMQYLVIFATGGMASPVLPLILLITVLFGLTAPGQRAWLVVLTVHLPVLWSITAIQLSGLVDLAPSALTGTGPQSPALALSIATFMSVAMVMATLFATAASTALEHMIDEALRTRDAALEARSAQARELTTLSGEIAHELKNPLASVKGLAQLVSRELERAGEAGAGGKSVERMQVLRREVDRMQGILDEFLNFSRPLVPLTQREVELRELVDHVVDLHEGVAGERRVELRAHGRARAVCDPRKLEQVLINLVQNALEVAPAASVIDLEIEGRAGRAGIVVRDRGPGIDPALRDRIFEPGVTGKGDGSGLGLTIARALARQHGGELELVDLEAGGCEARLTLPPANSPTGEKHA